MPKQTSEPVILLKFPLFAEPDKQRFAQFVMKCLEMFNVSQFLGAAKLPALLADISSDNEALDYGAEAGHLNLQLILLGSNLFIGTRKSSMTMPHQGNEKSNADRFFIRLAKQPSAETINEIRETLRAESEVSDPELLRQHNEGIRTEMKAAQERAAEELIQLEQKLNEKRSELQESIRAAEIDSLTQIYNRGAYDRRLLESVKHCQRQGKLLSLILLDLDYFKQVNDTLGHQAGDEVLKNMAKFLSQYTRKDVDHVCRMGGDEFAIIFFSDTSIACRAAEKILTSMDGKVSIGISQLRSDDSVETFIARTDAALYEAKERGRGQVVIDSELHGT